MNKIEANRSCGWEAVGQNVALHLPLLRAQISGRAPHAQIHPGDAANFNTCAGVSSSEFGDVCRIWCALLEHYILFFRHSLPPTAPIFAPRAPSERNNQAIQRCAQVGKRWGGCKGMP